jgi:peptidoglycan hydrolase-like protein with peptidoglycan-binding domain
MKAQLPMKTQLRRISTILVLLAGVGVTMASTTAMASASVAPTTTYTCDKVWYSGTAITEEGDTGARVIEVQCLLGPAYIPGSQVDGIFGAKTYAAVLRYQREFDNICNGGLSIDGVVGTFTWAALRSPCPS